MSNIEFGCLPTAIGGMPQTDAKAACAQVVYYLQDIPAWPQLPNRSYNENMYVQYSQGLPGLVIENERIYVDRTQAHKDLEQFYTDFTDAIAMINPLVREIDPAVRTWDFSITDVPEDPRAPYVPPSGGGGPTPGEIDWGQIMPCQTATGEPVECVPMPPPATLTAVALAAWLAWRRRRKA